MLSVDDINKLESELMIVCKQYNSLVVKYEEVLNHQKEVYDKILKICDNKGTLEEIKTIIENE